MIKKILKGYGEFFSHILKILLLVALCLLIGAAFVFPLWFFASSSPKAYTFFVLCAAGIILIFSLFKKIRKEGAKHFLLFAARLLIIFAGIYASVKLILNGFAPFSIPVILLTLFLYGFLTFAVREKKSASGDEK